LRKTSFEALMIFPSFFYAKEAINSFDDNENASALFYDKFFAMLPLPILNFHQCLVTEKKRKCVSYQS